MLQLQFTCWFPEHTAVQIDQLPWKANVGNLACIEESACNGYCCLYTASICVQVARAFQVLSFLIANLCSEQRTCCVLTPLSLHMCLLGMAIFPTVWKPSSLSTGIIDNESLMRLDGINRCNDSNLYCDHLDFFEIKSLMHMTLLYNSLPCFLFHQHLLIPLNLNYVPRLHPLHFSQAVKAHDSSVNDELGRR